MTLSTSILSEDLEDLISQAEAAEIRKCSRQAIRNLVVRKKLQTIKVGGKTFLKRKEVMNFSPSLGGRPRKKTEN